MKKSALLTLVVVAFLMIMASSPCLAQINGAAGTSKEGSLLIWPRVQTTDLNETYIFMTNNSPNDVTVKCYWEVKDDRNDPASQSLLADFAVQLYGYNTIVFRASDGTSLDNRGVAAGMGSEEGALKCWAVDPSMRRQISWNHLSGSAVIVNSDNTASGVTAPPTSTWQYNAWRFAANVIASDGTFADGFGVGPLVDAGDGANTLNLKASPTTVVDPRYCVGPDYIDSYCHLSNAAYDACPKYLTYNFLAEPSGATKMDGNAFNSLALVPCKSDLTDVTQSVGTKLVYTLWNEQAVMYTGVTQCANCAFESDLGNRYVLKNQKRFQMKNMNTPSGRFRVEATSGISCGTDSVSTPLLGVMSSQLAGGNSIVGTTGSTSGKETSDYGYIMWSPTGYYYQMIRR